MIELLLAAGATTLATGLGAIPVWLLGDDVARYRAAMLGVVAGVMGVAAIVGLILPGLEESDGVGEVGLGTLTGVGFLLVARAALDHHDGRRGVARDTRAWILIGAVLTVHSLPEGFAIGTAYASPTQGLGLFMVVAIAIQNIPEGTSVALPMATDGRRRAAQFWAAVGTSVPQPLGAAIAYLAVEQVSALLPFSFGFAAGAMLALVVVQVVPDALRAGARGASVGFIAGSALMLGLGIALDLGTT
ncbi:ZIP family metal transporter [Thermoleophilia bacterium SCSIO 60948]|nr:ZIP family metal transporter [Thermoleophilia bacterium SCSIO 60948]